jgi:hypothetical protein
MSLLLNAFSEENNNINFDWNKNYGTGFDTINFKTINSDSSL